VSCKSRYQLSEGGGGAVSLLSRPSAQRNIPLQGLCAGTSKGGRSVR